MAFGDDYANIFRDEEARKQFTSDIPKTASTLASTAMSHFHSILDAASLVFGNSIIDAVSLDSIRLCSLIAPQDLGSFIKDKKITLSAIHKKSVHDLTVEKVSDYVNSLDRKSLLKTIDVMFAICKPQPSYKPMADYEYDR